MYKLTFKPLELKDARLCFDNLEENVIYFSSGTLKKEFDYLTFKKYLEDHKKIIKEEKIGNRATFLILNKNKEYIGRCSINRFDKKNNSAKISLSIKEEFWGNGYGSEALNFLCKTAFTKFKLHRLQYGTYSYNERSKKLAEKNGFIYEGTLRDDKKIGNKYYDVLIYSKLKSEFKK
ncbi:MAG: GNAT family N-acetyltransferase [Candidatus Pacebacteria bacterium]|nr:GNAT family N-acetyltransferase [Candidatus Paceibacterota bacterium]MBP9866716.1 GNAT family N-acetyltransferase [Candidatus Paceibacterota bacterium]